MRCFVSSTLEMVNKATDMFVMKTVFSLMSIHVFGRMCRVNHRVNHAGKMLDPSCAAQSHDRSVINTSNELLYSLDSDICAHVQLLRVTST